MGVRQKLSQRRSSIIMALRRVLLLAVVVVLASVDLVTADGDKFHGKDCRSDDDCGPISFCDNSVKGSVGAKVLGTLVGKVSNTAGAAVEAVAGECRVSPTFWAVFFHCAHRRGQLDRLRLPLLLLLPALPPRKMLEAWRKCLVFYFFFETLFWDNFFLPFFFSFEKLFWDNFFLLFFFSFETLFWDNFPYFSSSLLRRYFGTILWDTPFIHPTTSENSRGQSFHFPTFLFDKWKKI